MNGWIQMDGQIMMDGKIEIDRWIKNGWLDQLD